MFDVLWVPVPVFETAVMFTMLCAHDVLSDGTPVLPSFVNPTLGMIVFGVIVAIKVGKKVAEIGEHTL
jgi:hypothetical protein